MADEGIFATTAEVQRKVGADASATSNEEAHINQFMTEVESLINTTTQFNWTDAFAALNVDVKGLLKMAASAKAAMMVLNYDMTGISQREVETRLDVLKDEFNMAMALLKDIDKKKFMVAVT